MAIPREENTEKQQSKAPRRKLSEYGKQLQEKQKVKEMYGKQLQEKQKVKEMYGLRERQFKRFFAVASKQQDGGPGENLLRLLERRLDNVTYRLKMATTRTQARQIITHGHILINGKKIYSPSFLVSPNDLVTLSERVSKLTIFLADVIDKRMKVGIKVPEWLELDKKERVGKVLRLPVRADVQVPIEEHLIVELYSK
jgi:small subunit ribosomal protein S4